MEIIQLYLVFWADSEYPIRFNESANPYYQNRWSTRQKPFKSGLLISILRIPMSYLCFFLDTFIPFCSFLKALSNEVDFSLDRHRCEYDFSSGIISICIFWVVYLSISPIAYPYPLFIGIFVIYSIDLVVICQVRPNSALTNIDLSVILALESSVYVCNIHF